MDGHGELTGEEGKGKMGARGRLLVVGEEEGAPWGATQEEARSRVVWWLFCSCELVLG
jgi:hypothetical protein